MGDLEDIRGSYTVDLKDEVVLKIQIILVDDDFFLNDGSKSDLIKTYNDDFLGWGGWVEAIGLGWVDGFWSYLNLRIG